MSRAETGRSFLCRLARDARGNTLALVAAAMIPLVGLIGGGVDMSRLYLTKSRLQQACDAGALAGRRAMGSGAWSTAGATSSLNRAKSLFTGNFQQGDYGTGTLTFDYTENAGEVTGTASVLVPMTLMRLFGFTERELDVTCTAKMELPNTDVMFVLDVTGSMNCVAGDASCSNNNNVPAAGSKIIGLKSAIKCFYEALVKVNTNEVCGSDPTATSYTQSAQIRLGFMPYAVNVNVGKLLPQDYIADNWTYQSRTYGTTTNYSSNTTNGNWSVQSGSTSTGTQTNQASCPADTYQAIDSYAPGTSTTAGNGTITTTQTQTRVETGRKNSCSSYWTWSGWRYDVSYTDYSNYTRQRTVTTTQTPNGNSTGYTYKPVSLNVSGLKKADGTWNSSVSLPVGTNGADKTVTWDGCIEERQTFQNIDGDPTDDWSPIPSSAYDMNINMVPTADATTKWGPMLQGAVWGRYTGSISYPSYYYAELKTSSNLDQSFVNYSCPTQASKLRSYNTATDLEDYVNSLVAVGNTYHDIGMIWGARFISPTGIFASENKQTSSGGQIQRHIIFMTDGDVRMFDIDYNAYGVTYWDRKQKTGTPDNSPYGTYNDDNSYNKMNNARLTALCTAVKNMNITLWVISYGGGLNPATETRLENCATTGHYYSASNNATLISRFRQIASEIADLRLTK